MDELITPLKEFVKNVPTAARHFTILASASLMGSIALWWVTRGTKPSAAVWVAVLALDLAALILLALAASQLVTRGTHRDTQVRGTATRRSRRQAVFGTRMVTGLQVLLIGEAARTQPIADRLTSHREVRTLERAPSAEYAFGAIRHLKGRGVDIDTVFIDPFADAYDPHQASLFVHTTRAEHPEVVFVLLVSHGELDKRLHDFLPEIRHRLRHYFTLDPTLTGGALESRLDAVIASCVAWHNNPDTLSERLRFEYDVAISFAGEDRELARDLAAILTRRGIRVFFDDYERPTLWGKNLYTTLYEVYSERARYCIILVSEAYRDKMWTGHERAAAQQRALEMRDSEYILPIRLDDATIPGLPRTVSYLPGTLPMSEIADIFMRKLGSAS